MSPKIIPPVFHQAVTAGAGASFNPPLRAIYAQEGGTVVATIGGTEVTYQVDLGVVLLGEFTSINATSTADCVGLR